MLYYTQAYVISTQLKLVLRKLAGLCSPGPAVSLINIDFRVLKIDQLHFDRTGKCRLNFPRGIKKMNPLKSVRTASLWLITFFYYRDSEHTKIKHNSWSGLDKWTMKETLCSTFSKLLHVQVLLSDTSTVVQQQSGTPIIQAVKSLKDHYAEVHRLPWVK